MDIDLSAAPNINYNNQSALYKYLRDVSNDSQFAISVLQVLIEERQTAHCSRWNKDRAVKMFQIGDVVKAHVQVQFNSSTGAVKKLSYQARGPFQIRELLNGNSYLVQRYNHESSATKKYKGFELYFFPPSLFPYNPIDTMDQRYLNYSFAPIVSPLKNSLQIELYNDIYFPSNSKHITSPTLDQASCRVDEFALKEHNIKLCIPSAASLFKDSDTPILALETKICISLNALSDTVNISDKLFFIQYTPEGTIRRH